MKYRGLLFLIVLSTFLSVTSTLFGATDEKKGIVLIIANSKYSDAADKLPNAVRDGEKIEKTFKQLNFEVITRKNLSNKEDIINSLFHFAEVARNKHYETAIIYYTGPLVSGKKL